jgi:hypothetical protein
MGLLCALFQARRRNAVEAKRDALLGRCSHNVDTSIAMYSNAVYIGLLLSSVDLFMHGPCLV